MLCFAFFWASCKMYHPFVPIYIKNQKDETNGKNR